MGQVERQVQALRKQIFAPKLLFDNLADLNVYLEGQSNSVRTSDPKIALHFSGCAWCELQDQKPHPENKTRKVVDIFEEERVQLRPVGRSFDGYVERGVRVSGTCSGRNMIPIAILFPSATRVLIAQARVSCAQQNSAYTFQTLSLRSYADRVVISNGKEIIAEHERCLGRYQKRFCLWHYLPLFQQKPGALRDGAPFKH